MKERVYKTSEASKMTGVPAKTLQRWTGKKSENSKNQELFNVQIDANGYRVYNDDDVATIAIVNLLLDFGLNYQNIRKLVTQSASPQSILEEHLKRLHNQMAKLLEIIHKINLVLQEEKHEKQFERLYELSRWLSPPADEEGILNELRQIRDDISQYCDYIQKIEHERLAEQSVHQTPLSSEEWDVIGKNIVALQDLIDEVKTKKIYLETRSLDINLPTPITSDNSLFLEFLSTASGQIVLEIGEAIYNIYDITYRCKHYEFGYSLNGGEYAPTYSILSLRERLKKVLRVPYLCLRDHHDGYPLFHKLYDYGDIENLKKGLYLGNCDFLLLDKHGRSLMYMAIEKQDLQTAKLFLQYGAEVDSYALEKLSDSDKISFLKLLLESTSNSICRFFLHALFENDHKAVRFIFHHYFPHLRQNFFEKYKDTAISFCCKVILLVGRNIEILSELLKNLKDKVSQTSFMYWAISQHDLGFIKVMLQYIDINLETGYKSFLARSLEEKNVAMVELLLDSGADVNQLSRDSVESSNVLTRLFTAVFHGPARTTQKILSLLINKGLSVDIFENLHHHNNVLASIAKQFDLSDDPDSKENHEIYRDMENKGAWNRILAEMAETIIENFVPPKQQAIFTALLRLNHNDFDREFEEFKLEYLPFHLKIITELDSVDKKQDVDQNRYQELIRLLCDHPLQKQLQTMLAILEGFNWFNQRYQNKFAHFFKQIEPFVIDNRMIPSLLASEDQN